MIIGAAVLIYVFGLLAFFYFIFLTLLSRLSCRGVHARLDYSLARIELRDVQQCVMLQRQAAAIVRQIRQVFAFEGIVQMR